MNTLTKVLKNTPTYSVSYNKIMTNQIAIEKIKITLGIEEDEVKKILEKAIAGGEFVDESDLKVWLEQRFLPNCILIDEIGYAKMCVDALKILSTTAPTDYGSSRQRDMGQLWADMTRGYLGELACLKFFEKNGIKATLGHEAGALQQYLPMDIHNIIQKDGTTREPKIKIGIKTTKWNGIWMDIPGNQFDHSDIHILVKVGAGRDHLFSFFKGLSVFKDKVLKKGVEVGSLSAKESDDLYSRLPNFKPIPAYVVGFARKDQVYSLLPYEGKRGKKHFNVTSWNGKISEGDLEKIKSKEDVVGSVKFEGIGEFAHDSGYLFNAGKLHWKSDDWKKFIFNIV